MPLASAIDLGAWIRDSVLAAADIPERRRMLESLLPDGGELAPGGLSYEEFDGEVDGSEMGRVAAHPALRDVTDQRSRDARALGTCHLGGAAVSRAQP